MYGRRVDRFDMRAVLDAGLDPGDWGTQHGSKEMLASWGMRVGLRARDSLHLGELLPALVSPVEPPVLRFFGSDHPGHAFNCEPHRWLKLSEVQCTGGLAGFLNEGGPDRILAFLRALAPHVVWPPHFDGARAEAEVRTRRGRIDLYLRGRVGHQVWGAVIEAKLDHHSRDNPLADYRRFTLANGARLWPTATAGGVILVILGRALCTTTARRLASNRDWEFAAWQSVLRRFERRLAGLRDDDEFRRFRRTLWERVV